VKDDFGPAVDPLVELVVGPNRLVQGQLAGNQPLLIPMSVVAIGVSTTTGRRPEIRGKLIAGAATQLIGCALLLTLGSQSADTPGICHVGVFLTVIAALFLALAVADRSLARFGKTGPEAETAPADNEATVN
jgi:hypothetical protein